MENGKPHVSSTLILTCVLRVIADIIGTHNIKPLEIPPKIQLQYVEKDPGFEKVMEEMACKTMQIADTCQPCYAFPIIYYLVLHYDTYFGDFSYLHWLTLFAQLLFFNCAGDYNHKAGKDCLRIRILST